MGELLTTQFRTKLTEGWEQIQSDIQTDALGGHRDAGNGPQDGDLERLGLWAASYFWQACTKEQQSQIQAVAMGALNQLGSALGGVFGNLSQLAMGLVAQFVPAAASATAGQTALNVAMDANPIFARHLPHRDAGGCAAELQRQKQRGRQRFPECLGRR